MPRTAIDRFEEKIKPNPSGCIDWTGGKIHGYGSFNNGFKTVRAHKWIWQYFNGVVAEGLCLDHLCGRPICVNIDHLEPVTQRENVLRGKGLTAINARKTHCHAGHELNQENTKTSSKGSRFCKTCYVKRYQARNLARSLRGCQQ